MEGLTELREAIATMASAAGESSVLSDDGLGETLVEIHRCRAQLAAVEARLTAAFDLRKAYAADGSRSAGAWLGRRCNTSPRATRRQAKRARRLRHMPVTGTALAAAEIDENHVNELAERAGSARKLVADAFPEAEEHLVDLAKRLPFDDFVQALRLGKSWSTKTAPRIGPHATSMPGACTSPRRSGATSSSTGSST